MMLNNVASGVLRMARNVILNHPNAWDCELYRKVVTRHSDGEAGGIPTLGGLGVMDNEDEDEYQYGFTGYAKAVQAEFFAPSLMMDKNDANNAFQPEMRFLVEPEAAPDSAGWFAIKKHDIAYIIIGNMAKLAFEVVGIETPGNIAPFAARYLMNRRGDMDFFSLEKGGKP